MHFIYNNEKYEIIIEKKHNKNLYIKVVDDLKIKVVAPFYYTSKMIQKIIIKNEKSIIKMLDTMIKRKNNRDDDNKYIFNKKIDIVFKDVKKPILNSNIIYVKDYAMFDKWYLKKAKEEFEKELKRVYNYFEEDILFPSVKIRNMKTRWGVCNRKNISITLNLRLLSKDKKYLEYVIIHELAHFVYFDHSKNFWNLVCKYCKDYKKIRGEMNLW